MTEGRRTAGIAARARSLLDQGAVEAAGQAIAEGLAASPHDSDLLLLQAHVMQGRQPAHEALPMLRRMVDERPDLAPAWFALANAQARLGAFAKAAQGYAEALVREPEWAHGHYNLGVMHRHLGDQPAAARAFHTAWRLEPKFRQAAQDCVLAVASWARESPVPPARRVPLEPAMPSVSIVVCSIDRSKEASVTALYRRLFAGVRMDLTVLRDARSLSEAYNRGIAATQGDVVLLSHDDVDVLAADFAPRLLRHLRTFDVVGVVGSVQVGGPAATWAGPRQVRGWIVHHAPGETAWHAGVLDPRPVASGLRVLDGVMMAARRDVFRQVAFDADTFDGFHLYDLDWSLRASRAGFRLAAAGDLLVVHASRGRYDASWRRYAERFCLGHELTSVPTARPPFYEATLANETEVRAFFARMVELADTTVDTLASSAAWAARLGQGDRACPPLPTPESAPSIVAGPRASET